MKYNTPRFFLEWQTRMSSPPYWHYMDTNGLMISLHHLIRKSAKWFLKIAEQRGLRNAVGEMARRMYPKKGIKDPKCAMFLDSGAMQNEELRPQKVLELQSKFKPDFVCHMDVMRNTKDTILNAIKTRELESSYNPKVYYVLQGKDVADYVKCFIKLKELKITRFAIGGLVGRGDKERIHIIEEIRKRITEDPQTELHVLGANSMRLLFKVKNYINSFDSSAPIRAATVEREGGRIYFLTEDKIWKIYYRDRGKEGFECRCPACREIDIFTDVYSLPKGTGARRHLRFLRAIHNAFMVSKALKMTGETLGS